MSRGTTTAGDDNADECAGFEELLLEAWEWCTDDEKLRASAEYGCVRKWLAGLTASERRGEQELAQLGQLVNALRATECDDYATLDQLLMELECKASAVGCGGTVCLLPAPPEPPATCGGVPPPRRDARRPQAANERLIAALAAADDDCMDMQRFFREVAAHTCDGGALLMRVTGDVLADFRSFVDTVFGNRVTQIGMVLAREQMAIRDRYAELECRTMNRAQLALMHVRDVMPTFDWNRYTTEPGYIKSVVVSRCLLGAQADDADGEDARAKGLLYQLNWLRSEIDRGECENHGLNAQHAALTAELAAINRSISEVQCRAASDMAKLSCELDKLRARSAEQVNTVDKLMESIQISIQNSKIDSTGGGGGGGGGGASSSAAP